MEFLLTSTSLSNPLVSELGYKKELICKDYRSFSTRKGAEAFLAGEDTAYGLASKTWKLKGSNHRIEEAPYDTYLVVRDMQRTPMYCIELQSIEDFVAFVDRVEFDVIVSRNWYFDKYEIEIYDGYRE